MLYYTWLIGLPMAVFFSVVISMWYEVRDEEDKRRG